MKRKKKTKPNQTEPFEIHTEIGNVSQYISISEWER